MMIRFYLCLFALLLTSLFNSCQKIQVDKHSRPKQFVMIALHDLNPTEAATDEGKCAKIELDVKMGSGHKDVEEVLGLDGDSLSMLLNLIERKVRTLNALVCNFNSPPDDKMIRSIARRSLVHAVTGKSSKWAVLCSTNTDGSEDCVYCEEDKDGGVSCVDFKIPPPSEDDR